MFGVQDIPAFLLAATLVIVVPGPATLYIAGHAQRSARGAVHGALGIIAGDLLLIALSGAGFSAVIAALPGLLSAITIAGGLYVTYLGVCLLSSPAPPDGHRTTRSGGFARGMLITLTNPKPILFFGTFFPTFLDPATGSWMQGFLALGVLFELVNVAYVAAVIAAVRQLRRASFVDGRSTGVVQRISGVGLVLCGALIAVSALTR